MWSEPITKEHPRAAMLKRGMTLRPLAEAIGIDKEAHRAVDPQGRTPNR